MTSDDTEMSNAATGRDSLVVQLRELEAFVAHSEASGDELPPEAIEMIARLREIVQALDGLTSSMMEPDQPTDSAAPPNGS